MEVANSKLRRLVSHNQSFNCTDIAIGGSVLLKKAQSRKRSPRWRGPAKILGFDDARATVTLQSQIFEVARRRVRKRLDEKDAR